MELLNQLKQLLLQAVLMAQAYGEGPYGGLTYGGDQSFDLGPFNLPLPNTGPGMLFWGGALLLALAVVVFAWRYFKKRKQTKAIVPVESSDQLLKY